MYDCVCFGQTIESSTAPLDLFTEKIKNKIDNINSVFDKSSRTFIKKANSLSKDSLFANLEIDNKTNRFDISTLDRFNTDLKVTGLKLDSILVVAKYLESIKDNQKFKEVNNLLQKWSEQQELVQQSRKYVDVVRAKINDLKLGTIVSKSRGKIKKLQKLLYYYEEKISMLKTSIDKPKEMLLKQVSNITANKDFVGYFQNWSQFQNAFHFPSVAGKGIEEFKKENPNLQFRADVIKQLEQKYGGSDKYVKDALSKARKELQEKQSSFIPRISTNIQLEKVKPPFVVNNQKNKKFLSRFEVRTDVEFSEKKQYIPRHSFLSLGLGYKLNDRFVAGFGSGIRVNMFASDKFNINIVGINYRLFSDYKLFKQVFFSTSFEANMLMLDPNLRTGLNNTLRDKHYTGLIGLSKKVKTNGIIKNSSIQVYWDYLNDPRNIVSTPIILRLGSSF